MRNRSIHPIREVDYDLASFTEAAFPRELERGRDWHRVDPTVVARWPFPSAWPAGGPKPPYSGERKYVWLMLLAMGVGLRHRIDEETTLHLDRCPPVWEVLPTLSPLHLYFQLYGTSHDVPGQGGVPRNAQEYAAWAYQGVPAFIDLCLREMGSRHGTSREEFEVVALRTENLRWASNQVFHMRLVFKHRHHMFATMADVRSMATAIIGQAHEEISDLEWLGLLAQAVYTSNDTPPRPDANRDNLPRSVLATLPASETALPHSLNLLRPTSSSLSNRRHCGMQGLATAGSQPGAQHRGLSRLCRRPTVGQQPQPYQA